MPGEVGDLFPGDGSGREVAPAPKPKAPPVVIHCQECGKEIPHAQIVSHLQREGARR